MSFFTPQLAIDAGTWKTRVSTSTGEVMMNEPSLVAIGSAHKDVVGVGEAVVPMVGKTPEGVEVWRPFQYGTVRDYKAAEILFRYSIEKALNSWQIFKPEVLLSAPVGVSAAERRAAFEVALRAGAKSAYVIQTPVLAALGAGIPVSTPGGHMIIDVGAGTVDIAVMSLGGIVSSRSLKAGGLSMDLAVHEYIKRKYGLLVGERTSDKIKRELGSVHEPVQKSLEVKGVDMVTGNLNHVELNGREIKEAIKDPMKEIVEAVKETLHSTPPEIASDIMDRGIVITGGGARLTGFRERIQEESNVTTSVVEDPDLAVIKGASKALKHISLYKRSILTT